MTNFLGHSSIFLYQHWEILFFPKGREWGPKPRPCAWWSAKGSTPRISGAVPKSLQTEGPEQLRRYRHPRYLAKLDNLSITRQVRLRERISAANAIDTTHWNISCVITGLFSRSLQQGPALIAVLAELPRALYCATSNRNWTQLKKNQHSWKQTTPPPKCSANNSEYRADFIPVSLMISLGEEIYFTVVSYLKAICLCDSSAQPAHGSVLCLECSSFFLSVQVLLFMSEASAALYTG